MLSKTGNRRVYNRQRSIQQTEEYTGDRGVYRRQRSIQETDKYTDRGVYVQETEESCLIKSHRVFEICNLESDYEQ